MIAFRVYITEAGRFKQSRLHSTLTHLLGWTTGMKRPAYMLGIRTF